MLKLMGKKKLIFYAQKLRLSIPMITLSITVLHLCSSMLSSGPVAQSVASLTAEYDPGPVPYFRGD